MRTLPCDCGQYLKAEDKEALFREVQAHLKQLVAERSYTLKDVQEVVYAEGDDGWEEGFESLFFDYAESMRAVVLGTRAG